MVVQEKVLYNESQVASKKQMHTHTNKHVITYTQNEMEFSSIKALTLEGEINKN